MEFKTVEAPLDWYATHRPAATIFHDDNDKISYLEFSQAVSQVATGLLQSGIKPRSRVALLAKDSISAYEIFFGCVKAKAVMVGVNWRLTSDEILYILDHSETEMLFVEKTFVAAIENVLPNLPRIRSIVVIDEHHHDYQSYRDWRNAQDRGAPALDRRETDTVVQLYTSGTTGKPKGVELAHYAFFRLINSMRAQGDNWMDINAGDRLLLSLPIFHIGGLWWAVQGVAAGGQCAIVNSFDARQVLGLIEKHRITKVAMVPAMIQFLLSEPSCTETDLSSVKAFLYGASPMPPPLMKRVRDIFPCDFYQIYGMTETGNMAVCLRPEDHFPIGSAKTQAVGKPLPGVSVRVVDASGDDAAPGEIGEIWIKSPSVMLGYWRDERATAATLSEGWIKTGDAGHFDGDGYLYISDRLKDMIIYAGEKIFPAEIEAVIAAHQHVREVAVVGVPDDHWGESIKAFVVPKPGCQLKRREIIDFARSKLADFKLPKSIDFIDRLPRNASGKILKRELRQPYWRDRKRQVN